MSPRRFQDGEVVRTGDITLIVLEHLGAGGMGEAYKVRNQALNDVQVLKTMHVDVAADPEQRRRFEWEARAGRKVHQPYPHANLARVEWLGRLEDEHKTPFFLMEFIEGDTLRAAIRDPRTGQPVRLPVRQGLNIAGQLLEALAALHEKGIVHQDVKPSNMLLCPSPKGDLVKLLDLGIMRVLSVDGASHAWAGTPPYSAPEQIVGRAVGPYTDVFAAAVVLFECLAGTRPWASFGDTPAGAVARVDREAPRLDEHGDFPRPLVDLVARGLALDVRHRFADAYDMHAGVERLARELKPVNVHEAVTSPNLAGPRRDADVQTFTEADLGGETDPADMSFAELHERMGIRPGDERSDGASPASTKADALASTQESPKPTRRSPAVNGGRRASVAVEARAPRAEIPQPPKPGVARDVAEVATDPPLAPLPTPRLAGVEYVASGNVAIAVAPAQVTPAPNAISGVVTRAPSRPPVVAEAQPPAASPAAATEVDPSPQRGPRGIEWALVRLREVYYRMVDASRARRDGVAVKELHYEAERELARLRKSAEKAAAREEREHARKQRLVERNRRRLDPSGNVRTSSTLVFGVTLAVVLAVGITAMAAQHWMRNRASDSGAIRAPGGGSR